MKITVILPCYFKRKYLLYTLNSLARQTLVPDEVIIVYDDKGKFFKTTFGQYPFKVTHISTNRKNLNYRTSVFAMNLGINAADDGIVILTSAESLQGKIT